VLVADRERLEQDIRALCSAGDTRAAAVLAVRGYGPEIFSFLSMIHRCEADASDAFSELSEALLRKLPEFAWECTLRTWTYAIARNVSRTMKRNQARRERRVAQAEDSAMEGIADAVRTETQAYLRTENKTKLQALRESLPEADQMLLVLRIDRKLEWNELARVLGESEGDAPIDPEMISREAARLRKRFQLVKTKLYELAKQEGLLD
jgi:RNA polymerase sigma-70 factor (ECF subfamily)